MHWILHFPCFEIYALYSKLRCCGNFTGHAILILRVTNFTKIHSSVRICNEFVKCGRIWDSIRFGAFFHLGKWSLRHVCVRMLLHFVLIDPIIFLHFNGCKNDSCKCLLSFLVLHYSVSFPFLMRSMFWAVLVATNHGRNWIIRQRQGCRLSWCTLH